MGLEPSGLKVEAAHWLALVILRQQPRRTPAAEICAVVSGSGGCTSWLDDLEALQRR
ncbi:hypothetical protein [Amycolatopsis sp. CA-126428]|uniref:hypothetical protein n=1 Tax=Amycolatopsis sp. CA-126428 TaxID=2073158 RepID=UPI001304FFA3|nr:hypothetical protein [Amycolatopsis sp. CA-126428]